jgi:hypothetical protein
MTDDQSIEGWDVKRRYDERRKRHRKVNCLHMQARDAVRIQPLLMIASYPALPWKKREKEEMKQRGMMPAT